MTLNGSVVWINCGSAQKTSTELSNCQIVNLAPKSNILNVVSSRITFCYYFVTIYSKWFTIGSNNTLVDNYIISSFSLQACYKSEYCPSTEPGNNIYIYTKYMPWKELYEFLFPIAKEPNCSNDIIRVTICPDQPTLVPGLMRWKKCSEKNIWDYLIHPGSTSYLSVFWLDSFNSKVCDKL